MYYSSLPISTLYVKANFKRSPYKNAIVTFRLVGHTYAEFTANKALMLVDTNPDTVTLEQVYAIAETMRVKANALKVVVKMPQPVYKTLAKRST
jgi:hypothetical protein